MIRLRDRTRWCTELIGGMRRGPQGHPLAHYRGVYCERRIGWWASWFTDRCHQHRDGGAR